MKPFDALQLAARKILVVASTGGHLAQAMKVVELTGVSTDSLIVTFCSPQSELLTEGYRVAYVPYVAPRDYRGIVRAAPRLRRILRTERFDAVLSTGAGIALSAFSVAPRGTRLIYLESFSRFDGPSVTGRIARWLPRVETYTQHLRWADQRWKYIGDVAPPCVTEPAAAVGPITGRLPRFFVTLGTIRPYRFDALLDRLRETLPANCEVTWQVGCTTRSDLPGRVVEMLPADEFVAEAQRADVVVSHAGVGTAMALLEMGKYTVLVPRRAARNEHVDDHQVQICRELEARRLVVYREVDTLATEDLLVGPSAA